jgi:hypothetical protein
MSLFHKICPCCFGTPENGDTYRMQHQQAQPGTQLELTASQLTPKRILDPTTSDEGTHILSGQLPPENNETLVKSSTFRPQEGLVCNDMNYYIFATR